MEPTVSIVLIVRNGEDILSDCLDSISRLDYPKDKLEVVVVDNNSSDRTREIIKKYPFKYIFERKIGCAAARNKGIKESTGELVAFTDADCIVDKDWITNLVKGFEDKFVGGCGGRFMSYKLQSLAEMYMDLSRFKDQEYTMKMNNMRIHSMSHFPFIMGGNSCYPRKVLEQVGLFDDNFKWLDDVEISIKISTCNYRFKYIKDAIVFCRHKKEAFSLFKKLFNYGYFTPLLYKKYSRIIGPFLTNTIKKEVYLFLNIWKVLGCLVGYILKCKKRVVLIFLMYDFLTRSAFLVGMLAGSIRWITKRRTITPCL